MSHNLWETAAWAELRRLAATGDPFTADDLLHRVGHPDSGHGPNGRNNAIGSLFRRASTTGLIRAVGVTQSSQAHRKGGMVRIWQGTAGLGAAGGGLLGFDEVEL